MTDTTARDAHTTDVLIVGAGPTGLGAATRLHQRDHKDWCLIDQVRTHAEEGAAAACPKTSPAHRLPQLKGL